MSKAAKYFTGLEGFVWFVGVVEDRQDPEQMGRVRVRCFGWHTDDKEKIPTETLPWAHVVTPTTSVVAYSPKEGDMVMGFFMDSSAAQNPVVLGIFPGKPDKKPDYNIGFSDPGKDLGKRPKKPDDESEKYPKTKYLKESTFNRLARGKADGTVIATRKKNLKKGINSAGGVSWSEPPPTFKPVYPYNNAVETESGHAFELDDTPGNERVHLAHRSGAYTEFDKTGSKIERVQKDNYAVIMGDDFIYIKGKASITVDGNFNLKTKTINIEASEINMAADGAVKIKGSSVKIESTGGMDLKAGAGGKFTAGGRLDLKGATAGLGGATVDIPAGKVNLQSGSVGSASGTGLKGGGAAPPAEDVEEAANTAATQAANTAASANSVSAGADSLQEVTITSKKVEGNTKTSLLGKIAGGITSTVNSIVDVVGKAADGIIKDFANKIPLGEIAGKVEGFATAINDNVASITSLAKDPKKSVLSKIDNVSKLAYDNNIDFKFDKTLQKEILSTVYNVGDEKLTNVIAKRVYPKTETIQTSNIPLYEEYADVFNRFQAQTDESEIDSNISDILGLLDKDQ